MDCSGKINGGVIDLKEQCIKTFDEQKENWERKFRNFIVKHQQEEEVEEDDIPKTGIALYLDIFNFDEVTEILKKNIIFPILMEVGNANIEYDQSIM